MPMQKGEVDLTMSVQGIANELRVEIMIHKKEAPDWFSTITRGVFSKLFSPYWASATSTSPQPSPEGEGFSIEAMVAFE
jgi:hypothetical protein